MRGNIIEKCQDNFWFLNNIFEEFPDKQVFWENTLIEDNYSLYMGYGWSNDPRFTYPNQPLNTYHKDGDAFHINIGVSKPSEMRNMVVKNNVFYLSNGGWIVGIPDMYEPTHVVKFSGNTYVQNDNRFILWAEEGKSPMPECLTAEEIKAALAVFIGDKEAVVFDTSVAY